MTQIIENGSLIVLGAIINAAGLFLMTKGSLVSSKKDKSDIIDKLKGFREEMTVIKGTITNKESLSILKNIEQEFNEWAETFVGNIESKKVEQQKSDILLKEKELNLSRQWRHIYQYIFEVIQQMLTAYNQKTKNKIDFILPELPYNLFGNEAELFKGSIIFGDSTGWTIVLSITKPYKEDEIPSMLIHFYFVESSGKNVREAVEKGHGGKLLLLAFDPRRECLRTRQGDPNVYLGKIESEYSISVDKYKTSIKELFTALIEFQIVNLKG
jgi:hypothetical protein